MPKIIKLKEPALQVDSSKRDQVAAWGWLQARKLRLGSDHNYRLKVW